MCVVGCVFMPVSVSACFSLGNLKRTSGHSAVQAVVFL